MKGTEIEFKFRVEDEAALDAFASALGLDRREFPARRQQNNFFDSADGRLRSQGLALRLRIEEGHGLLTIKGKSVSRSEDGALTERFEAECRVALAEAQALLADAQSPLNYMLRSEDPLVSEGAARVQAALDGQKLTFLGAFDNERTTLPAVQLAIGGRSESLVFELDRTSFPHGRVECEIEAEIGPDTDPRLTSEHLARLLADANIPWSPAPSKLARFLAILEESP